MTAHVHLPSPTGERRAVLGRCAQLLAAASVLYNVVEAVVAIAAGAVASSMALVGFGLDSLVEMASGLVILWQFRSALPKSRERQALRLIAISFFALAGFVGFESVRSLLGGEAAGHSTVGIVVAAASLVIMPLLSWAQRRTGRELSSGSVVADSKQTLLCTYLSAVVLVGLLANSLLGWWWARPARGDRRRRRGPARGAGGVARAGLRVWPRWAKGAASPDHPR